MPQRDGQSFRLLPEMTAIAARAAKETQGGRVNFVARWDQLHELTSEPQG
jgi:hypothetical protein